MSLKICAVCFLATIPSCLASKYGHFQIPEWVLLVLFVIMLLLIRYTCRQICKSPQMGRPQPICRNYPQPAEVILTLSLNTDILDGSQIPVTPPPAYSATAPAGTHTASNTYPEQKLPV